MRKPVFLLLASLSVPLTLVALFGSGCSPSVEMKHPGEGGGGSGGDFLVSTTVTTYSGGGFDGGHQDAFDEFNEQPCPDAGPPKEDFQCDAFDQQNGDCAPGEGCYITVQYPSETCGQEIYGSVCLPSGPSGQGEGCQGPQDCKGGFACVVAGIGAPICVKLCPLEDASGCPNGLVCENIDVGGFGGCL